MKLRLIIALFLSCILMPQKALSQSIGSGIVIQGTVIAQSDGLGLIGATVVEMDAKQRIMAATITDMNGHFVLPLKNPANNITISYIGFESVTLEVGSKRTFDLSLKDDLNLMQEHVVVAEKKTSDGIFAVPQRELSTAVQTFNTKELDGIQSTSIDEALQGRIAGLDIVANSGDPGSGTSMRIRGTTSINGNKEPLIVVNGVPYEVPIDDNFDFANANEDQFANLLSINPDDIEEISVLKDGASTAVWGSRGANGVLVIKTKKGLRGPTRLQYSYRVTGIVQPQGMDMLNGDDYTMMMKQAYFNPEQNENAANVREYLYDPTFSEFENFNNNTDWVKEVQQVGFKHDHYLTLSGGGERARYRIAGGFFNQTGTIIGQELDRISTRAYFDYLVSDRITFISEVAFTYTNNQRSYSEKTNENEIAASLLDIAYRKMPNVSVYQQDANGMNTGTYYNIRRDSELNSSQRDLRNPVALAHLATNNLTNFRILPTFRLQYDILDPSVSSLRYDMYVAFDVNNNKLSKFLPAEASNAFWNDDAVNAAESADSESMKVRVENNFTWTPRFSNPNHSLLLLGSIQIETGNSTAQGIRTTNLPSNAIVDAAAYGFLRDFTTSTFSFRNNAILARGHYAFKSKYIFGFTARREGSTKFGAENKYATFPGVSAKWIISDEPFMSGTRNWLSFLAIRPSWGISGNQPDAEYLHYSRYASYGSYMGQAATRPSSLKLSNLKWEATTSINYGLDLGLFNDKLIFDFNIYQKRTEDLLFKNARLPSSSGYTTTAWQNIGIMDNNGWEVNFQSNNLIKTKDFRWDFNFNLSNYTNTVVELREDVLNSYNGDYDYNNGTYLSRLQEGNSYGSIYGFRYKGVYQYNDYIEGEQESAPVARDPNGGVIVDSDGEPLPMYFAYGRESSRYEFVGGDARYEDINYDGTIDELDIVYLGNSNPKVNGGFGSTLRYKNFGITAFFNFRYGNKIVNRARMNAENMYSNDNQTTTVNWRWRKDGDVTDVPRALYQYGYNWLGSDRYVEDGSFLRFKNLQFNYSFAKEKLKKLKMQQLNLYVTLNNLYVWTNYTGVDPEVGYGSFGVSSDNARTPRSRDVTLGLTIVF